MSLTAGHGHLQASKAKYQELLSKFPEARIIKKDVMIDWVGKWLGGFFTWLWNHGQSTGNMAILEFCSSCQKAADTLFWIPIFFSALVILLKEDVDTVVDTQVFGTSPILKVLRLIHRWKGKRILMEKVITDLPTDSTSLYFETIKRLSQKDKKYLKIVTTKPLLNDQAKDEGAFWKKYCNLTEAEVIYDTLPIRRSFLQYANLPRRDGPLTLDITTSDPNETHLIHRAILFGSGKSKRMKNTLSYTIEPEDKVAMFMLGANPHDEAIFAYLGGFIDAIRKKQYKHRKDHLFICCSRVEKVKTLMQKNIVELLKRTPNYPKSLTIIPLPFQEDQIIAPLFHRSNATITRSGGLTSMELLTVSQGMVLIHKGAPPRHLPSFLLKRKTLEEGMPPWEKGNAKYLQAKKGAQFVTPQTFNEVTQTYFAEVEDEAASVCLEASTGASAPATREPCKI